MRIGMAMVGAALLLAIAAAQEPAKPQESVFRSATRTVAVYATVSDAQGRLVPDLTREDFEVYDDGKRQELTLFENGSQPITVVLLLDRSGSMVGNFNLVRSAAEQFVGALRTGDKARIGSFANRIQLDPRDFTSNKRDMIAILRTELQEAGPTPLWNAVNVGITALLHQDGRRVVLVFTDGVDRPDGNNNVSFREVARNAAREDVMVYAIGLAGRAGVRRTQARLRRCRRRRRHRSCAGPDSQSRCRSRIRACRRSRPRRGADTSSSPPPTTCRPRSSVSRMSSTVSMRSPSRRRSSTGRRTGLRSAFAAPI